MQGVLLGGRYRILEVLRAGGFGQTYIAEDTQRPGNPRCLVKQLRPAKKDDEAFLQVTRRLFNTEAEILEKLGMHDQIPQLLAYFEDHQEFYLVQEFVVGQTLSDELGRKKRLSEGQTIKMLQDALGILQFVHSQQVIHRDVKPHNLIRRQKDNKLVLIDFGAVKEIGNQLAGEVDETGMTVAVGTRGYMPSEQLVGKPRFNSDIYAMGMTAIQALTGMRPSQLLEDPYTGEVSWRDRAQVSDRFGDILDKMVRYDFRERYQSIAEVLQALNNLTQRPVTLSLQLPVQLSGQVASTVSLDRSSLRLLGRKTQQFFERNFRTGPLAIVQSLLPTGNRKRTGKQRALRQRLRQAAIAPLTIGIAALSVTVGVAVARYAGGLQPLELTLYDRMLQRQPKEQPDPRILIVTIAESDFTAGSGLDKETVANLLQKLQTYQPAAIGLDLDLAQLQEADQDRDADQDTDQDALARQLTRPNVIITRDLAAPANETSQLVRSPEQLAFRDILTDPDEVVRRTWLLTNPGDGIIHSLPLRMAVNYLNSRREYTIIEGVDGLSEIQSSQSGDIQLGRSLFLPLKGNSGGYQRLDVEGHQVLLNYRAANPLAQTVTLTDLLSNQFSPDWVRDKAVIVGSIDGDLGQLFATPYQIEEGEPLEMPRTLLHAQMLSQILSASLDARPLFGFWSEGKEILWILGWGIIGGTLVWFSRDYLVLGGGAALLLCLLSYSYYHHFNQDKWIPFVAPALSLTITGGVIKVWCLAQSSRQKQALQDNSPKVTTNPSDFHQSGRWPQQESSPGGEDITAADAPPVFPEEGTAVEYLSAANSDLNARPRGVDARSGKRAETNNLHPRGAVPITQIEQADSLTVADLGGGAGGSAYSTAAHERLDPPTAIENNPAAFQGVGPEEETDIELQPGTMLEEIPASADAPTNLEPLPGGDVGVGQAQTAEPDSPTDIELNLGAMPVDVESDAPTDLELHPNPMSVDADPEAPTDLELPEVYAGEEEAAEPDAPTDIELNLGAVPADVEPDAPTDIELNLDAMSADVEPDAPTDLEMLDAYAGGEEVAAPDASTDIELNLGTVPADVEPDAPTDLELHPSAMSVDADPEAPTDLELPEVYAGEGETAEPDAPTNIELNLDAMSANAEPDAPTEIELLDAYAMGEQTAEPDAPTNLELNSGAIADEASDAPTDLELDPGVILPNVEPDAPTDIELNPQVISNDAAPDAPTDLELSPRSSSIHSGMTADMEEVGFEDTTNFGPPPSFPSSGKKNVEPARQPHSPRPSPDRSDTLPLSENLALRSQNRPESVLDKLAALEQAEFSETHDIADALGQMPASSDTAAKSLSGGDRAIEPSGQPSQGSAKQPDNVPPVTHKRLTVQPGMGGIIVRDRVQARQRCYYVLHGGQNQLLSVQVISGHINLAVFDANSSLLGTISPPGRGRWQDWLASNGEYTIGITSSQVADYAISVELTNENSGLSDNTLLPVEGESRDRAAEGKRIINKLSSHQNKEYEFACQRGQKMTVQTIGGEVELVAIAPDGRKLKTQIAAAKQWRSTLPATGTYRFQVSALSATVIRIQVE